MTYHMLQVDFNPRISQQCLHRRSVTIATGTNESCASNLQQTKVINFMAMSMHEKVMIVMLADTGMPRGQYEKMDTPCR